MKSHLVVFSDRLFSCTYSRETEVERADTGCVMHTRELEWGRPLACLVLNSIVKLYVGRKP